MKNLIAGIVTVVMFAMSSPSGFAQPVLDQAPIAEIPYRIDYQGWITIQTTVNGQGPHDFIVDTGATITSVFQNLADQQGFLPADREPIRVIGLIGAERLPAYQLGNIHEGQAGLVNHIGVILPDWASPNTPPQGVIGLDFLSRFTVLVDSRRKVIVLYPRDAGITDLEKDWSTTRLRPMRFGQDAANPSLYTVTLRIRRKRIECVVDLGASGTVFNVAAFRRMTSGLYVNGDRRGGFSTGTRISDVFDNRDRARVVRIDRLSIGRQVWRKGLYIVHDAEIFRELGVAKQAFCLVGADIFATHSFMFDFANETLYIGPEA
ncbi:MAG: aspartyl protease family protein [Pseudomonadota bacterium]